MPPPSPVWLSHRQPGEKGWRTRFCGSRGSTNRRRTHQTAFAPLFTPDSSFSRLLFFPRLAHLALRRFSRIVIRGGKRRWEASTPSLREKRFRRKVHAKEYYSSGSFYFTVLKIRRFLFSSWRKGKRKRKERKREENKTLERESNKLDREIVFTFEQSIHNKDVNFGYPILRSDPSELL